MAEHDNNESVENRDMLYLAGGAALLVLGAGLILAHPTVRTSVVAADGKKYD